MTVVTGFEPIGVLAERMVKDTLRHMQAERVAQLNRLTGTITDSAGTITLDFDLAGLQPGSLLEVDDELMYVWSTDEDAKTAVVQRGHLNTTATAHTAGTAVTIEPRFYRQQILDTLRDEIESWPVQLVGVLDVTLDSVANTSYVDLGNVLDNYTGLRLLRAQIERPFSTQVGVVSDQRQPRLEGVSLERTYTLGVPTGWTVRYPYMTSLGTPLRLTFGAHFQPAGMTSGTDVGSMGLTRSMLDIPPIGAAVRLLYGIEIGRTDDAAQGRSRLAEEVPPGFAARTAEELASWRERRIGEETRRLLNDYGWTGV